MQVILFSAIVIILMPNQSFCFCNFCCIMYFTGSKETDQFALMQANLSKFALNIDKYFE